MKPLLIIQIVQAGGIIAVIACLWGLLGIWQDKFDTKESRLSGCSLLLIILLEALVLLACSEALQKRFSLDDSNVAPNVELTGRGADNEN